MLIKLNHCQSCVVCPKREVWESPCEKHHRTVKVKSYKLVNGECLPHVTSAQERCSCPSGAVQRIRCDGNGQLTKCTLTYTFEAASKQCKARKLCVNWRQTCPASKRSNVGTCGPETGYRQRISQVNYTLDRATCKCKPRIVNKWDAYCGKWRNEICQSRSCSADFMTQSCLSLYLAVLKGCKHNIPISTHLLVLLPQILYAFPDCAHLNARNVSCDKGVKTTTITTYKLIDGECIPDETSKSEKIGKQIQTCSLCCKRWNAWWFNGVSVGCVAIERVNYWPATDPLSEHTQQFNSKFLTREIHLVRNGLKVHWKQLNYGGQRNDLFLLQFVHYQERRLALVTAIQTHQLVVS